MAKKRIYYNEFSRSLDIEPLKPIYLFTGQEDFLKEQALRAIIDKVLDPSERQMNLEMLYAASDVSGREAIERAETLPFLGNCRVLIIRQADKWKTSDLEVLTDYANRPCASSVMVIVSPEERLKTQAWKKLANLVYHVECYPLFDNQVPIWIERRIADHGKRITRDGLAMLIEKVGQQLGDLDNEITKLGNYVGTQPLITAEDIQAATGDLRHDTTFELNAACGKKDIKAALRLSERVLTEGIAPLQLLGSLTWHFRHLYSMKKKIGSGEDMDKVLAGYRNPQAKKEMQEQLNVCSLVEFEGLFKTLLDLDIKAKSSYQHWILALQLAIMKWCGKKTSPNQTIRA